MTERSIAAYDVSQRVKTYDADMELMHPNRSKMVQVALEVLPFPKTAALRAIDLGIGTGYFTERFLNNFPNSRVLGIDGAQAMIELAKARLKSLASRVEFVIGDFRKLQELAPDAGTVDVVFSAYALHHLSRPDKETVLRQVVELLVPGGWFVNADLIVADSPELESRLQEIRVAGIVERARGSDNRFADSASTRRFLADLEKNERDQPLTLAEDLERPSEFWSEERLRVLARIPRAGERRTKMTFAIKAAVSDPRARTFAFTAQKTMYGGKHIARGDIIFVFASENEGGPGLIASGVVTSAKAIAKKRGVARQTPRVSITIRRTALAKRRLGRSELKRFCDWNDDRPETELNFKFYRQATNKIVGISDKAAAFLRGFF